MIPFFWPRHGAIPARRRQATQPAGHRRPIPARGSAGHPKCCNSPPAHWEGAPCPSSGRRVTFTRTRQQRPCKPSRGPPGRVATPKRPRRHRVASNVSHNGVVRGGSPAAGCWRMPEPSVKEWASDGKTRDGDAERPLMLPCPAGMPAPRAWPGARRDRPECPRCQSGHGHRRSPAPAQAIANTGATSHLSVKQETLRGASTASANPRLTRACKSPGQKPCETSHVFLRDICARHG
ncbi:hypothetical protein EV666_101143 [Camelimonas lactis]|uniref:Uncharacterized protein n=1 Tax=Camelimonas lactis TaxID=659006 RepID=A0A4R2GXX8_9HYPH|nr:hypothetical protein EV666_101143 [Camelimonas lactis]